MIKYKIIIIILIILLSIQSHYLYKIYKYYSYRIPKNIFTYWHTSELDPLINFHIDIWKKKLPDWDIHTITMDNIDLYIDKTYYESYLHLSQQAFSDHLRLYLLEKYGGLWMDGSILILHPHFIDNLYTNMINNKSVLGLFEYKHRTVDDQAPYLESWFIMAPFNSSAIKKWRRELDKCHKNHKIINTNEDNCKNKIISTNTNIDTTIKYNNYLMIHAVLNMLCKNKNILLDKISILQASDSMFYIQDINDWDTEKVGEVIFNDKLVNYNNLYAIKFTGGFRNFLSEKFDLYNNSISKLYL